MMLVLLLLMMITASLPQLRNYLCLLSPKSTERRVCVCTRYIFGYLRVIIVRSKQSVLKCTGPIIDPWHFCLVTWKVKKVGVTIISLVRLFSVKTANTFTGIGSGYFYNLYHTITTTTRFNDDRRQPRPLLGAVTDDHHRRTSYCTNVKPREWNDFFE